MSWLNNLNAAEAGAIYSTVSRKEIGAPMKHFPADFALDWRFTDPQYNRLPAEDLGRIQPQSQENTRRLWDTYVSNRHNHITGFKSDELPPHHAFRTDWNAKELSRQRIARQIPIAEDEEVLFFWSPSCSVLVDWGTVIKYWDDFFYPSDDNTVVVVPRRGYRFFYSDESFLLPDQR
jgi:hypothetical protein